MENSQTKGLKRNKKNQNSNVGSSGVVIHHGIVEEGLDDEDMELTKADLAVQKRKRNDEKNENVTKKTKGEGNKSVPAKKEEEKIEKISKDVEVVQENKNMQETQSDSKPWQNSGDVEGGTDQQQGKRKRKKTRSKQKNIRKDSRSDDSKPEHLRVGSKGYRGRPLTKETKVHLNIPMNNRRKVGDKKGGSNGSN